MPAERVLSWSVERCGSQLGVIEDEAQEGAWATAGDGFAEETGGAIIRENFALGDGREPGVKIGGDFDAEADVGGVDGLGVGDGGAIRPIF